jgi:uncharacterized membrane protein
MKFTEKHPRTIVKAVTWRVLLTISHIVNAFIATGSLIVGLKIAGLATVINSVLYWSHERVWNWWQWNRKDDEKRTFAEGQPRTISKMLTWRVLITCSNFIIPYIMTGSWGSAVIFAGLATAVNMLIFWSHERVWNIVTWGKEKKIEEEVLPT